MRTYATMARHEPDFLGHSGDTMYTDGPMEETVGLPTGGVRRDLVTPEKAKVAETLHEFRGQWEHKLLDANVRDFHATVPTFLQWDDHEVVDNWSSGEDLTVDVHDTAANHHSRDGAAFLNFEPVREFVTGPLHSGSFGPDDLDGTFGSAVRFAEATAEARGADPPPSEGLQSFGLVGIDGDSGRMTVRLMDRDDAELWSTTLDPARDG